MLTQEVEEEVARAWGDEGQAKALCRHCDEFIELSPSGWRHSETGEHYCLPGDLAAAGRTIEEIESVPQAEPIIPEGGRDNVD